MSIASELTNLEGNIEDSYDAVNDMGGIIPAQRNMDNLDQAIRTIPQNQGATYTAGNGINIDANNEISIDDTVVAELSDIPGVMIGATSGAPGVGGTVPAPAAGDDTKFLAGDGTWQTVSAGGPTIFYTSDMGASNPTTVYKDDAHTIAATGGEIFTAFQNGGVMIYDLYFEWWSQVIAMVENGGEIMLEIVGPDWSSGSSYPATSFCRRSLTYSSSSATTAEFDDFYVNETFYTNHSGLVPAPAAGDDTKFLSGDGTWSKVSSDNIVGGTAGDTLANGALVEVVGTTTGNSANYAWKYADGRLINFQHYELSGNATTAWGNVYSGVFLTPRNYAVAFTATPIVAAQLDWTAASGNCWLAQANEKGSATTTHPGGYQLVRPTSMSGLSTGASIVAYGFWK